MLMSGRPGRGEDVTEVSSNVFHYVMEVSSDVFHYVTELSSNVFHDVIQRLA